MDGLVYFFYILLYIHPLTSGSATSDSQCFALLSSIVI